MHKKKGEADNIINYLPVCFLSNFSKIIEQVIHLVDLLDACGAAVDCQFGFRKGRTAVMAIYSVIIQ